MSELQAVQAGGSTQGTLSAGKSNRSELAKSPFAALLAALGGVSGLSVSSSNQAEKSTETLEGFTRALRSKGQITGRLARSEQNADSVGGEYSDDTLQSLGWKLNRKDMRRDKSEALSQSDSNGAAEAVGAQGAGKHTNLSGTVSSGQDEDDSSEKSSVKLASESQEKAPADMDKLRDILANRVSRKTSPLWAQTDTADAETSLPSVDSPTDRISRKGFDLSAVKSRVVENTTTNKTSTGVKSEGTANDQLAVTGAQSEEEPEARVSRADFRSALAQKISTKQSTETSGQQTVSESAGKDASTVKATIAEETGAKNSSRSDRKSTSTSRASYTDTGTRSNTDAGDVKTGAETQTTQERSAGSANSNSGTKEKILNLETAESAKEQDVPDEGGELKTESGARADQTAGTQMTTSRATGSTQFVRMSPSTFQQSFAQYLDLSLSQASAQGFHRATISIEPPYLGKLDIELKVQGNNVRATFVASTAAVKSLLESSMADLQQSFSDAGLEGGEAQVFLRDNGSNGSGSERRNGDRSAKSSRVEEAAISAANTTESTRRYPDQIINVKV